MHESGFHRCARSRRRRSRAVGLARLEEFARKARKLLHTTDWRRRPATGWLCAGGPLLPALSVGEHARRTSSRHVAGLRAGMRDSERSSRRPRLWPEAFKSKISTSRTIKSTKAPLATIKLTTISTTVPHRRLTRDRSKLQMLQTPTRSSGQWVRPFGQCFSHPWDLYSHLFTAWPPIHE